MEKTKILIVDDNPLNVKLLDQMLIQSGYETFCSYDGKEAWATLNTELDIKAVLLDRMMPGVSGLGLLAMIRSSETLKDTQVIIVSSLDGSQEILAGSIAGANQYLSKPIDKALLLSALRNCIGDYDRLIEANAQAEKMTRKASLFELFVSVLDTHSDESNPMGLLSHLRGVMRNEMNIPGDPFITTAAEEDVTGINVQDEKIRVCSLPYVAILALDSTVEQRQDVLKMMALMGKHIQLCFSQQQEKKAREHLHSVAETAASKTLDLIKEIDEATEPITQEALFQKMKINLLDILVATGRDDLSSELERLRTGATSGDSSAQNQSDIDALLAAFG